MGRERRLGRALGIGLAAAGAGASQEAQAITPPKWEYEQMVERGINIMEGYIADIHLKNGGIELKPVKRKVPEQAVDVYVNGRLVGTVAAEGTTDLDANQMLSEVEFHRAAEDVLDQASIAYTIEEPIDFEK